MTYSIVAYDAASGSLGVAAQSHWLAVGATVTWGEPGVGVIATQSYTDPAYGPAGLALLRVGRHPRETLDALTGIDEYAARRQVAVLDRGGRVSVHTGARCIPAAGHRAADGVAAQANMMRAQGVWDVMVEAYQAADGEPLAERLVTALEAAEDAGGDVRGAQSAAILVVDAVPRGRSWSATTMNLRVDDHDAPTGELRRLVRLHRAYEEVHAGRAALERDDTEGALAAYRRAGDAAPGNEEIAFWHAVTLARTGDVERGGEVLAPVAQREPAWLELLERLPAAGLLDGEVARALAARAG